MKKIIFILIAMLGSIFYSNASEQSYKPLDFEKVKKDIDSIKTYQVDSAVFYAKETGKIWIREIKQNGFKDTMKKGKDIFLPIVIVFILYLFWLRNRNKK